MRRRPARHVIAGVLAASALISCSSGVPPARTPPLVPTHGAYLGAYVQSGASVASETHALSSFIDATGQQPKIVNRYYPWQTPFPTSAESADIGASRIPMISWNGTSTSAIISGRFDRMIRDRADAVKALGSDVFLRFFWEMDGAKKVAWVQSPQSFIDAWRHVHDLFVQQGATNAVWVWCPNAFAFSDRQAQSYYPGDSYVDWIGADGYDWGGHRTGSFEQIFSGFYSSEAGRKPLMVPEVGTVTTNPGAATWITSMGQTLQQRFPDIRAVCWFDANDPPHDWTLTDSPKTLAAWSKLASQSYFRPQRNA